MNLDFSDEQKQLRDQIRRFLGEKCPSSAVRAVLEGPESYDKGLYRGLAEMGVLGAAIPEEAREEIFERFRRGPAVGENVRGHGLGLNIARELVRAHGGELRLVEGANHNYTRHADELAQAVVQFATS